MSSLVPFILGRLSWAEKLAARCPMPGCVVVDVLDPASLPFFRLVNAANARAYGGLAMPSWVQLDCATLPAGMIGFARHREEVSSVIVDDLLRRAALPHAETRGYGGLVPLSEYACVPSVEPGHVVGFSLFSLVAGLGVRTKAMALAMHAARRQTGVAQVENPALRTHAALGPLDVVAAPVANHDYPATTLCYTLRVPAREVLSRIALGESLPERAPATTRVRISPQAALEVGALIASEGPHAIVDVSHQEIGLRAASAF